ncbi:fatty-acid amide hydrolase [Aspergillus insuetus]
MGLAARGWVAQATQCRDILKESMPISYQISEEKLPPKELLITETTATDLVKKMGSGTWTAEEVTIAFLKRATIEDALYQAKRLDAIFQETHELVGPLHGVPISVKEHVGIKGRVYNAGFLGWSDFVSPDDAHIVQFLRNAGAIMHVRTNEPQSLMHMDSANNITGRTLNPFNRNLSPGGSSGGEGASLGFRCAVLGVGTDIGGSSRLPAAFNGVYGLRPTAFRLPLAGLRATGPGQESIRGVIGPLAGSGLGQNPWKMNPSLVPVPWRLVDTPTGLAVGIMKNDNVVHPHPPIARALLVTEKKLQAAGVNVVEWVPFQHEQINKIPISLFSADGHRNLKEAPETSGEPILPLTDAVLNWGNEIRVYENWELNYKREILRAQYHGLMQQRGVDLILSPAYVGVAPKNETGTYIGYTSVWNVLDHPSVVIPTGLAVDQELDVSDTTYRPRSELDAREQAKYAPERFTDAPIGLQLIGKRFGDEELLARAKLVHQIITSP